MLASFKPPCIMRESASTSALSRARLVLDCGVDEQPIDRALTIDERGMKFTSRWQFPLGTQLAIGCQSRHPRLGQRLVRLEGIVVWCERRLRPADDAPTYETTVLFLELPDDLRQSLREFSYRLTAAG